jgi:hypothetical protein
MSAYDPIDTVRWMIAETAAEMDDPTMTDAAGRRRPKTRAQRDREQARLEILCEVIWNCEGRSEPLATVVARSTAPVAVAA